MDATRPSALRQAEHHVAEARRIVVRQRRTVTRIQAINGYAQRETELLAAFEQSLVIFEDDLAAITDALKSRVV
jgi:hypothetical protein